ALDINVYGQMCGVSPACFLPRAVRWMGLNDRIQNINNFLPPGAPTMDSAEAVNGVGQVITEEPGFPFGGFLLTPPTKQITLYAPDPGLAGRINTFTVYGATPGAPVRFYWGLRVGTTSVPGCPRVNVSIRMANLGGQATADANGRASLIGFTSNAARGRIIYY